MLPDILMSATTAQTHIWTGTSTVPPNPNKEPEQTSAKISLGEGSGMERSAQGSRLFLTGMWSESGVHVSEHGAQMH